MTHPMKAYRRGSKNELKSYIIQVCCEDLAKTDLEYICKESSGLWMAGGEGQHYYQMFFCPFCGEELP